MTGYLSNLIARSNRLPEGTGAEHILMPRLPSLYELPADPAGLRVPGGAFGASAERTAEASTDREGREDRPRQPLHAAPPGRRERSEPTTPPRGMGTEAEKSNRKHSGKKGADLNQIEGNAREFRTFAQGIPMYSWESSNLEGALEMEGQTRASAVPRKPAPAASGKEGSENETPDRPLAGRYPLEPQGPVLLPKTVGMPADRQNFAVETGEPEGWPAAPDIHIRIGRIEVRAVPAAAQAAARPVAAPQPKLTLDEYLRRRNEGKR